jgi:hypothetical protein
MGNDKKKKGFWRLRATQEETAKATKQVEERNTPQSLRPEGLRMGKRKSRLESRKQVQIKNQVSKNRKKKARGEASEKTEVESATPVNPEGTPDVSKKTEVKNTAKEKAISKQKAISEQTVVRSIVGQDWRDFIEDTKKVNKGAVDTIAPFATVEENLNPGGKMAGKFFEWYFNKYNKGK